MSIRPAIILAATIALAALPACSSTDDEQGGGAQNTALAAKPTPASAKALKEEGAAQPAKTSASDHDAAADSSDETDAESTPTPDLDGASKTPAKPTHQLVELDRLSVKVPLAWERTPTDSGSLISIQPRDVATSRAIDLYRDGLRFSDASSSFMPWVFEYRQRLEQQLEVKPKLNKDGDAAEIASRFTLTTPTSSEFDTSGPWLRTRLRIEERAPGTRVQEHWLLLGDDGLYTMVITSRRDDLEADLQIAQIVLDGVELKSASALTKLRTELSDAQACEMPLPPETWGFDPIERGFRIRPPLELEQIRMPPELRVLAIDPTPGDEEAQQNLIALFEEKLAAKYAVEGLTWEGNWQLRAGLRSFELSLTGTHLESGQIVRERTAIIFGKRATWIIGASGGEAGFSALENYSKRFLEGFEERQAEKRVQG